MSTPSKLDIIRAAGQVQREIAAAGAGAGTSAAAATGTASTDQTVVADVHPPPSDNVTTRRRRQDPLEQITEELSDVQSDLRGEQRLLQHLRRVHYPEGEEFEDALDGDDLGDGVTPDTGDAVPGHPPFTPDWFAKVIGAAMAAASSTSTSGSSSRSTKLKITDRKLPDFWEWQPVAWFRLFDRHVKPFKPTQAETFDALLPLLSTEACKHVEPIVRSPGLDPYTRARSSLIRHFDKTPRDNARVFRRLESLGDMMPSDMLEHIYGLLPDPAVIYEVVFLDLLPAAARDAALQHSTLSAMASAADRIVREGSASPAVAPSQAISSVSSQFEDLSFGGDVAAVADRRPPRQASGAQRRPGQRQRQDTRQRSPRAPRFLCSNHLRWGKNAHRCADPSSCHMKDLIKPPSAARPSGNGQAGGQ